MDNVIAQEITAYFIDRTVSLTKQCLGMTLITSRFVGKLFSSRAKPFKPLSWTPSKSIATRGIVLTETAEGIATAMLSADARGRTALVARPPEGEVDEAKRAVAAKDDWVVNAVAVPHEHSATAETVAAAVAFILRYICDAKKKRCLA